MAIHLFTRKSGRPRKAIDDGVFVKQGMPNLEVEVEKSNSLFKASLVGSFRAPSVLQHNTAEQSISLEYLHGIQSIRSVYLNYMCAARPSDEDFQFLVRTGTVLAELHETLLLQESVDWAPSELFKRAFRKQTHRDLEVIIDSMPWSIAHCDYGFSNIHFTQEAGGDRELVIIDPSSNGFVTTETNLRAPVYVDLANLISCISGLVPIRNYRLIHWGRLDFLIQSIIRAYSRRSNLEINTDLLDGMVFATARCYFFTAYRFPASIFGSWLLFTPLKRLRD